MALQYRHLAGVALSTLAVLAAHTGLLRHLGAVQPQEQAVARALPPIAWRWVVPTPAPQPPAPDTTPLARAPTPAKEAARRAAAPSTTPARPARQRVDSAPGPAATEASVDTGVAAPAPEPPPLNLDLPTRRQPPSLMDQVRNDPRVHTAPVSASERFARTLGTDTQLHEERRGEGRWRFRQGTGCADVRTSRAAQLDPSREAAAPTPKLVEPCN